MTAIPSPSLRAYVTAGIVGLAAALAVGDPTPALIGAGLLVLAVIGLAGGSSPRVQLTAHDVPVSAVEGEEIEVTIRVAVDQPVRRIQVDMGLSGLEIADVVGGRRVGSSAFTLRGEVAEIRVTIRATRWGRATLGPMLLHTDSAFGMFDLRHQGSERHQIVVVPAEITLRTLLAPLETNLHVGDLVSRHRGGGSEFADLRRFWHGDDPRSVNWRVSSRSDHLWVNDRHPERNGDVLLLVDAQVESGTGLETMVDRAVRAGAALLRAHGRRHHRLGLITLDGLCRWVYPGIGEWHRRRLLEQLIGVAPGEVMWEAAERAVIRAARRPSLVIALTPLLDPSMAGLIHTLRRSGIDVSVMALDVDPILPSPRGQVRMLGRRIWAMEQDRLRDRLAGEGIPVVVWHSIDPPEVPLARLDEMRTRWRRPG